MTTEQAILICIPSIEWEETFRPLAELAEDAARRQLKAPPGARQDAMRFSATCSDIERMAIEKFGHGTVELVADAGDLDPGDSGTPSLRLPWYKAADGLPKPIIERFPELQRHVSEGGVVLEVRRPFSVGTTALAEAVGAGIEPSSVWRPPGELTGYPAVVARWEGLLDNAASGSAEAIVPTGVSNRILTEGLRRFAAKAAGAEPHDARVVYRDGSEGRPFPLRAVELGSTLQGASIFRVALLSMRHPEMDPEVDACWLRNRDVSQVRPSAETDDLVTSLSLDQLDRLTRDGPVEIHMFQTGLEPAVVGFYRSVVLHLIEYPGSVSVVPWYYRSGGGFNEGTTW